MVAIRIDREDTQSHHRAEHRVKGCKLVGTLLLLAFRNIDDVLRKEAGCTTELDYTEQTSWLLFLK